MNTITLIQDVPEGYLLLTDSQDVEAMLEFLPYDVRQYVADNNLSGFFVKIENGEYVSVFGFEGTIPYLNKEIYEVW